MLVGLFGMGLVFYLGNSGNIFCIFYLFEMILFFWCLGFVKFYFLVIGVFLVGFFKLMYFIFFFVVVYYEYFY